MKTEMKTVRLPLTFDMLKQLDHEQVMDMLFMSTVEEFRGLLASVPPEKRLGTWTLITPDILYEFSSEYHEAILDLLPQCAAIRDRERDKLRVLSIAFNVHVAGTDSRCPYPIDFCVRINGFRAGVNLLIRPNPEKFPLSRFAKANIETGPQIDAIELMRELIPFGINQLSDYELILMPMYRPCCLDPFQIGTAGGQFTADTDELNQVVLRETKEEFKGFHYLGWRPLVVDQVYQSGNVFELQSIGVAVGALDDHVEVATSEGIKDWYAIPLRDAMEYLHDHPNFDGKISHGLLALFDLMNTELGW